MGGLLIAVECFGQQVSKPVQPDLKDAAVLIK
jgi:hypothetical protein